MFHPEMTLSRVCQQKTLSGLPGRCGISNDRHEHMILYNAHPAPSGSRGLRPHLHLHDRHTPIYIFILIMEKNTTFS